MQQQSNLEWRRKSASPLTGFECKLKPLNDIELASNFLLTVLLFLSSLPHLLHLLSARWSTDLRSVCRRSASISGQRGTECAGTWPGLRWQQQVGQSKMALQLWRCEYSCTCPSLLSNPLHTFNSISNSIVVVFLIERNLRGTFSGTQFTWILPDLVYRHCWPNTHAHMCVCVHVSTGHCGHVQFVCPIYSRVRVVKAQNAEKCKTWQQLPNNTNRHENNSNNNIDNNNSHINNNNSCRSELNQGRFYY